jgi:REP element-mobilizing transposase RayT
MARPLRVEKAGGWYHLTARGNERRAIFRDDRDREHFLELLAELVSQFRVHLHAYVLMDNHYHLLAELREPNLSRSMQWLNVSYSVWFNRRHERSGHLFQGRFKSVIVNPAEWGLPLSRYMHLNPVRVSRLGLDKPAQRRQRAGVSEAPDPKQVHARLALLRRFRWSSYRAYIGISEPAAGLDCGAVLALGGGRGDEQPRLYREYVESAVREALSKSPWEELKEQAVLGGQEFLQRLRGGLKGDAREQRAAGRLATARPTLSAVIAAVEAVKGARWDEFKDQHGDRGRDLALYLGRKLCGLRLEPLALATGMRDYASAAMAVRRYAVVLGKDAEERKRLGAVTELLNV